MRSFLIVIAVVVAGATAAQAQQAPRYSTYLGGNGFDAGAAVAVGPDGAIYSAHGEDFGGSARRDVRIIKLAPVTRALQYVVVIGGTGDDLPLGIAVAPDGSVWVTGLTESANFTLVNPIQTPVADPSRAAFLARLAPTGSLTFSTVFAPTAGTTSFGQTVVADGNGSAVFSGVTCGSSVPATAGVFQPSSAGFCDGFVARVSSAGALQSATYLGGSANERLASVAIGPDGDIYVGGTTESVNMATSPGAFQPTPGARACAIPGFPCLDGFVGRFSPDLSTRRYLTYLRETDPASASPVANDSVAAIAVGPLGDAYVTGDTGNGNLFPTTAGAYRTTCGVCDRAGEAFVTHLSPSGSGLMYSTFLGGAAPAGTASQFPSSIAVDADGRAWVSGSTTSIDFPVVNGLQVSLSGPSDAFVSRLSALGTALEYSTYFGGSGDEFTRSIVLEGSIAWIAGQTGSPNLRVSPDALDSTPGGSQDGFITAIAASDSLLSIDTPAEGQVTLPFQVAGWSIDRAGLFGSGMDVIHVYAFPNPGSGAAPLFLGSSPTNIARPDIAARYGAQFENAGWAVTVESLAAGPYVIVAYGHSIVTNTFTVIATRSVFVDSRPLMSIDSPADGAVLPPGSRVFVGGWAIDFGAPSGPGIDAVHVWIYPNGGAGTPFFAGVANYGVSRPDVGAIFGTRFTPSGFELDVDGLASGNYLIAVFAHSTVSNTFAIVQTRSVTIQ
jgi:hypothetical protein